MKKILLFLFLLPVLGWFSTACQELKEKDAVELVFAETNMLDPDHLQLQYESPDPGCGIPKIYWIAATAEENSLTLKCGGTDSLVAIGSRGAGAFTAQPDGKITSEAGHWTAVLTDAKTLSFTFDGVEDPDAEEYVGGGLTVSAVAGGRQTLVDFDITRLLRRHEPLTIFYD